MKLARGSLGQTLRRSFAVTAVMAAVLTVAGTQAASAAPSLSVLKEPVPASGVVSGGYKNTVKWRIYFSCDSITENCVDFTITDTLEPGLVTKAYSGTGGLITGVTSSGQTTEWTAADMSAGDGGFVEIEAIAPCSTSDQTFGNVATVTNTGSPSATSAPADIIVNAASDCSPPPPPPPSKSSPYWVNQGGRAPFSFTLPWGTGAGSYQVVDPVPAGLLFESASVGAPSTLELSCDGGTSYVPQFDYSAAGPFGSCSKGSGYWNVTHVRFTVPPSSSPLWPDDVNSSSAGINMRVPPSTAVGTSYTNSTTIAGTPVSASMEVAGDSPMPNVGKWRAVTPGSDAPEWFGDATHTLTDGDLGYQIRISNTGNSGTAGADLVNPIVTDLLDPNVTYTTENWWRVSGINNAGALSGAGCNAPVFTQTPDWNGTGRTQLRWEFADCTFPHGGTDPEIYLEMTVRSAPGLPAGTVIDNSAQISPGPAGPQVDPVLCAPAVMDSTDIDGDGNTTEYLCQYGYGDSWTVPKLATVTSSKWVNGAADPAGFYSRYPDVGKTAVDANGYATYQLYIELVGNTTSDTFEIVDILPHVGDTSTVRNTPRLSEWNQELAGPIEVSYLSRDVAVPGAPAYDQNPALFTPLSGGSDFAVSYSDSTNPCRLSAASFGKLHVDGMSFPAGCTSSPWNLPSSTSATSFGVKVTRDLLGYTPTTEHGDILRVTVRVKSINEPVTAAELNKVAWNSFGYTVTDTDGTEFLSSEPIKVGVEMSGDAPVTASLGNYVWWDEDHEGDQDGFEMGINGVTVRLYDALGDLVGETITGNDPADPTKKGYYRFYGLDPDSTYTVKLDNLADYGAGAPLDGFTLTLDNAGDDAADSDAVADLAGFPSIDAAPTSGAGSYVPTYDIGFFKQPFYSLGNRVWFDDDNDGSINDAAAPGVGGVVLDLLDSSGNPVLDGANAPIQTTTDAQGYYRFDNLIPGEYIVEVASTNFAIGMPLEGRLTSTGALQKEDPDDSTDDSRDNGLDTLVNGAVRSAPVTLGPGLSEPSGEADAPLGQGAEDLRANMTVDFGFYTPLHAIGDYVWYDIDRDGFQDSTELPVDGVTVSLFKSDGTPAGVTTTNPDGAYHFDDVLAGDYYVVFSDLPAGFSFTTDTNPAVTQNSNADPTPGATYGRTPMFTIDQTLPAVDGLIDGLLGGEWIDRTIDAGIVPSFSVGDTVFHDINNNSTQDGSDPGIDGVTVELFAAGADGKPTGSPVATAVTDNGGKYLFSGLVDGDYVVVIPGSNFAPAGALEGFSSSGTTVFGETDPALSNTDIDLDDNGMAMGGDVISSVITLGPGLTAEPTGEPATPGHPDPRPDAMVNSTVDFGFYTMSLGNLIFLDPNNNGVKDDASEVGLEGVPVRLYLDADADGVPDGPAIATTTTSATGEYLFTGLVAGSYLVEIVPPDAYLSSSGLDSSLTGPFEPGVGDDHAADSADHGTTFDSAGTRVIRSGPIGLVAGAEPASSVETDGLTLANAAVDLNTDTTIDFGLVAAASLGDYVWVDANRDGVQNEPASAGVNGVRVVLLDSAGNQVAETVTANDGSGNPGRYHFDVVPGDYKVRFDLTTLPAGHQVTLQDSGTDDLADSDADPTTGEAIVTTIDLGENDPSWDLGIWTTASIGNRVWFDENHNGIQDDGEPDIANISVELLDADGNVIATTTTDSSGTYTFSGLVPGVYSVRFILPNGAVATLGNVGTDDESDSDPDTNLATEKTELTSGENDPSWDLGVWTDDPAVRAALLGQPLPTTPTTPTTSTPTRSSSPNTGASGGEAGGSLAFTGASIAAMLAAFAALMISGSAASGVARRRRRDDA